MNDLSIIRTITRREITTFFDSLTAYVLLILFLGFSGFFTWLFGNDIFKSGQASLTVFFQWSFWTLFFFIPGITMNTLAEENNNGTLEMLSTKPINDWHIVLGKFFSSWVLVIIALLLTLPYYFSVSRLGSVDHGAVVGGYLGLILMSGAYIAIGIFASGISKNQIVAFLVTLFIAIFFQLLFDLLSSTNMGFLANIMSFLSVNNHFTSMARGVIDLRDIFYFFSLITAGLMLAKYMLSKRTLTD